MKLHEIPWSPMNAGTESPSEQEFVTQTIAEGNTHSVVICFIQKSEFNVLYHFRISLIDQLSNLNYIK